MRNMRKSILAGLVALGLIATVAPASAAGLPAPTLTGQAVDQRAVLDWDAVAGARDYVVYDVSTSSSGRVVGAVGATEWTSPRLPLSREKYSFQVVARDPAKVQGTRSNVVDIYPAGAPTEPPPTDPEPPVEEPTDPTDPPEEPTDPTTPPVTDRESVKLGAAVSLARLQDPAYRQTFLENFDSLTAENEMKARLLQPQRGVFDFDAADELVNFALSNGKEVRGHTLFWHGANPTWLTNGNFTPDEWKQLIDSQATNVAGHFAGKIESWDVLNEIVAEDGVGPNGNGLRTDNPWVNGHGGDPIDAIERMFRAAHAADPNAKLYINDFSVEFNRPKTEAYYNLVKTLVDRGVPIHGVGFQAHLITESEGPGVSDPGGWSPTLAEATGILQRFADLGVDVQYTEVDIKTSPTPGTVEQKLQAQADMYGVLAGACQAVERCTKLTTWGINDSQSWLGASEMALPFTDNFVAKPAYHAVRDIIGDSTEEPTEPTPTDPEPVVVPAPTGLTAVAQADRSVVLDWDDVPNADAYRIYEPRTTGPVTEVTVSTRTSPPLAPGDYTYTVTTVIDGVESAPSNAAPVTVTDGTTTPTDPEPPTEPTDPDPEVPAEQPVRSWDYENANNLLDVWPEVHSPNAARQYVTTQNPYPGRSKTAYFSVQRGETGWNGTSGTLRSEVRDSIVNSGGLDEGQEQYWAWSTFVPSDFDWDERGQFFGIAQWHQRANSGNPQVHVWIDVNENLMIDVRGGSGGTSSGDAQYTRTYNLGPIQKGAWNDITIRFVWSSNNSQGVTEVWHQGDKVLSAVGANKYVNQQGYFKYGIYSAAGYQKPNHWIQEAPVAWGTSLESVRDFNRIHPPVG